MSIFLERSFYNVPFIFTGKKTVLTNEKKMDQPSSVIFYILVTGIKSDNLRLFGVRLDPKLSWGPPGPQAMS